MATTFDAPPRLRRLPGSGPLAGVAAGIAKHAGLRPLAVRIGFVLGGIPGAVLYAVFWVVLPADVESVDTPEQRRGLVLALLLFAGGVALLATQLGLLSLGPFVLPAAAIAVGVALVWRQSDREQRRHWVSTVTTSRRGDLLRLAGGVVLVVAGLAGFLALRGDLRATRDGLLASVLLLGGVAVLALPWILAQADEARRERRQRIRVEERAEVAAHLHDSVLQTLVLIQKAADDPRQVARLARSQERALRGWLFGQEPAAGGLRAGLELAAADVEASFGVSVEVVAVGDCPGSERVDAVVAAAREAMVNAAKHSGTQTVQVFAEAGAEDMSVFVRDRGVGFDPSTVPADRLGISRSVHARMERQGGVAEIRSTPGEGAEVRLVMPRG
jgi:signal transduction histidine kinase